MTDGASPPVDGCSRARFHPHLERHAQDRLVKDTGSCGRHTRLLREVVPDQVAALKAQPGNDMGLGGANIAATLMRLGLIDEYLLLVHPVVPGRGIPCFPPLEAANRLRLVETRTFHFGVVYLRYRRVDEGHEHES